MGNMSYCRFQNTVSDLDECLEHWEDDDLSKDEDFARIRMFDLMKDLVDSTDRQTVENLNAEEEE